MGTFDDRSAELSLEPLRRLAHALVLERSSADDVVQEAWLAALQARGEIRGLGNWLAGAARRLARNRSRSDLRRAERERRAARPELEPSVHESSARIEILREVLAAVDRLPQPYRDAVVLRYLDDLPPREIARRLDVPVNTARTHVRRGIERLRADLDAGPGRDREAFLGALLPLLGPRADIASPTANPLVRTSRRIVMQHPLAITVSILGLVATGWVWQQRGSSRNVSETVEGASAPALAQQAVDASPARARAQEEPATTQRGRAGLQTDGWTMRGYAHGAAGAELTGRVFAGTDTEGTPLFEESFRVGENGEFAWTIAPPRTFVTIELSGQRPKYRADLYRNWFVPGDPAPDDVVVTLSPLDRTIRGIVLDANGAPLGGASVGPALGEERRAVTSASDGSFELPCTSDYPPRVVGAWLTGFAPGCAEVDRDAGSERTYELRLQPELRLHGRVRDREGAPVVGAMVSAGERSWPTGSSVVPDAGKAQVTRSTFWTLDGTWPTAVTDAEGRWELGGIDALSTSITLTARAPDYRAAERRCERPSTLVDRELGFSLVPGLTVTGRVRSGSTAVWGAYVTIGDSPGEIADVQAWCDADGRFTLENVPPGRQHLWIWRNGLAQLRHDVTVTTGMPELELELRPGHWVAGIVLDAAGEPLRWSYVGAEDPTGAQPSRFELWTNTKADGRFLFRSLPEGRVALRVGGGPAEEVALDRDDIVLRLPPPEEERPPQPSSSSVTIITGSGKRAALPPTPAPVAGDPVVAVTASSGSARLEGRLTTPGDVALADQEIELAAVESSVAAGPWYTRTDARGGFAFGQLPAGTLDVRWLRREGDFETIDLEARVTLATGEARVEDLRPRGKTTVRGRLEFMDMPGQPVSATPFEMPALVAFTLGRVQNRAILPGRRGTFAHDGSFVVEGLEPGDWSIEAQVVFSSGGTTTTSAVMSRIRVPDGGVSEIVVSVLRPQTPR